MTSKNCKKVCITLSYFEKSLLLASIVTVCISFSAFASLLGILIGITSSATGLKICTIVAAIKKGKSIIKKKKKKHDKIIFLAKSRLNSLDRSLNF